ncbi:aminopeptidase P family protein [Candidatus Bipolaricaulota bacterium]|nr:aminopeptidase P family protein [Candidatus Bipolaricaulota bacterium]
MLLQTSNKELKRRNEKAKRILSEKDLEGFCLFSPTYIFYFTGFSFIATERPIALLFNSEKDVMELVVPALEKDHVEDLPSFIQAESYPEYPGKNHPMNFVKKRINDLGLDKKSACLGIDSDGYAGGYGYKGPSLSETLDHSEVENIKETLDKTMMVKSPEEIEMIKESARWGNLAHRLLQEYSAPGMIETEISERASFEASMAMIKTLGEDYSLTKYGSRPASANFRGQIGSKSAIPHAITTNAKLKEGDILITGASSEVGGYISELERTMVLGKPTAKQEKYFNLIVELQDLALDTIEPGIPCSKVDEVVRKFYKDKGIWEHWRHHVGHALGYRMHEAPFFDLGDETIIEPGMVFSVEPGIFIPGFAGFRHSDTVLVTEDGIEYITYYPRDLESLTID